MICKWFAPLPLIFLSLSQFNFFFPSLKWPFDWQRNTSLLLSRKRKQEKDIFFQTLIVYRYTYKQTTKWKFDSFKTFWILFQKNSLGIERRKNIINKTNENSGKKKQLRKQNICQLLLYFPITDIRRRHEHSRGKTCLRLIPPQPKVIARHSYGIFIFLFQFLHHTTDTHAAYPKLPPTNFKKMRN